MRYQELTESAINTATEETITPEAIRDIITNECSDFIKMSNGEPLYRGVNIGGEGIDFDDIFIEAEPYKERLPTNTWPEMHNIVVEMMKKREFPVNRANCFFCSGDHRIASGYGEVYRIFPINGFKYMWSNQVDDFFSNKKSHIFSRDKSEWLQYIDTLLDTYKPTDLLDGIYSGHEIMIGGRCYMIHEDYFDDNLGD